MDRTVIYEQGHHIAVSYIAQPLINRNIVIRVSRIPLNNSTHIKLYEVDNHGFNYSCTIDPLYFNKMKVEQALEINYEELQVQIVDLLKEEQIDQMFLRLEADTCKCKMIFYEKARLKSLIFLTIDLAVTDQREIIDEMSGNIIKLKDANRDLNVQVNMISTQLREKDAELKTNTASNRIFENHVKKNVLILENAFCQTILRVERDISEKLIRLNNRHVKLLNSVEAVKSESRLKTESSARLVNSMHNLRLEHERGSKLTEDLRLELNHQTILKNNAEQKCAEMRTASANKDYEITDLRAKVDELKKDLQDATVIIAQKSKTHDEIAKDLVQANTMLVNFNNQYDALAKELDETREVALKREALAKQHAEQTKRITDEFARYKEQFNTDEWTKTKQELFFAKQNVQELEKQHKEAVKLNGLLTRKLSGDQNPRTWGPPSQRTNY